MAIVDDLRVRRALLAAEAISGDRDKAVAWLQEPIATFGGKTITGSDHNGVMFTSFYRGGRSDKERG